MLEIYEMFGSGLMKIIIAAMVLIVGRIIVPWLKEQRVYSLIVKLVRAAEKLAESGKIDKESKKTYVIKLLIAKGYTVSPEIEAFIEAAVTELDLAIESGLLLMPDIFGEAEICDEYDVTADLAVELMTPDSEGDPEVA